nr:hypothetical protein [Tanacetum cinerariifolium]
MATTKSFEDGLMEVEDKLEEIFTRFQKCFTQVRQEFSLRSDQNNKYTNCFKESVKEDSSKTEGNPTISEEDGTDSLRDQGEDDWQMICRIFMTRLIPFSLRSDQNNKKTDCFKESVKEDSSKTEGNPTISEEDGTDSLREQGEDDWQPASENDLKNINDTLNSYNLKPRVVVTQDDRARSKPSRCSYGPDLRCDHVLHLMVDQGLGSNYKSSGLEFQSTMILVLHLESNGLYGLLFGQMMTWDPRIRVIKILKQHLEDKMSGPSFPALFELQHTTSKRFSGVGLDDWERLLSNYCGGFQNQQLSLHQLMAAMVKQEPSTPDPQILHNHHHQKQLICAQIYAASELMLSGNFSHAQGILARLSHHIPSPISPTYKNPIQRSSFYFKEALQMQMDFGMSNSIPTPSNVELGLMHENLSQFAQEIGISFDLQVVNFDSFDPNSFSVSGNEASCRSEFSSTVNFDSFIRNSVASAFHKTSITKGSGVT